MAIHAAPSRGQRYARVDIPHMVPCELALASCARAASSPAALLEALRGARVVGEAIGCGPDTMGRLVGAEQLMTAETPGDIVRVLRGLDFVSPQLASDVVGMADSVGFFGVGPLLDIAKGAAGGALGKILPGGGMAAQAGQAVAPAGGGGFPGGGGGSPAGGGGRSNSWLINTPPPIIVRY